MSEVTLEKILLSRDNRAKKQKDLIKKYKKPIISFTMNIAGPKKTSPLIVRAFNTGCEKLKKSLPADKVICCEKYFYDTGCEAFFCVDMPASDIKKLCESIEDENPLGRLFDMDVIDEYNTKLSRNHERRCIVCASPGKTCAAGRLHTVEELQRVTDNIMRDFFLEHDKQTCADFAVKSLIKEVKTTPKPGLVDSKNSGSHSDMNIDTFIKSANSLHLYFGECFSTGHKTKELSPCEVFPLLKEEGIKAEKTMYSATDGVNTHKGIIYSLGIICGAIGRLWSADNPYKNIDEITAICSEISHSAIESDFKNISTQTAGGRLYKSHGIKGIRGEVLSGFLTVKEISLPTYIGALADGMSENDAGVLALIKLISCVNDTNLYKRGGVSGVEFAKEYALSLLNEKSSDFIDEVQKMDDEFIKRNLSPGGCADLLAITYFLYDIKKHSD